jgi:hypothetical protein
MAMGSVSPPTGAPLSAASPETEPGFAAIGAAGLAPRPGGRARHRDSRRRGIRPAWAVAAALVLVFAGVAGTYLTVSGSPSGKAAGPVASPLVVATHSRAALARTASPAASHRPSARATTPSGQASATAAVTPAAANTPGAATTPVSTAPAGNPGPTGPNLVADGDFSDPSLSAWNNQVLNTAVVPGGSRGGYAAEMSANPTAGISQIITGLKPGTEYELTGWIISDTGNYSTYVGVKAYDSTSGVSRALNSTTWAEAALTFTPAAGHTTAEVFCWQAVVGTGYCTDVSVRAMS